jgi:hypothetical protein
MKSLSRQSMPTIGSPRLQLTSARILGSATSSRPAPLIQSFACTLSLSLSTLNAPGSVYASSCPRGIIQMDLASQRFLRLTNCVATTQPNAGRVVVAPSPQRLSPKTAQGKLLSSKAIRLKF